LKDRKRLPLSYWNSVNGAYLTMWWFRAGNLGNSSALGKGFVELFNL